MSTTRPRVLYLLSVWPEPTSTATGIRSRDLVALWIRQGWAVDCVATAPENEFARALRELGAETQVFLANDPHFNAWVRERAPTYAVFDRFYTEEHWGWRVETQSPATVRVLDTQDLHFLRRARDRALEEGVTDVRIARAEIPFFGTGDAERELSAIFRSDLTLICSEFEEQLLTERLGVPASALARAPLFHPEPAPSLPDFSARTGMIAIGNLRHPPNAEGVRWLRRELWPRIREQLPTATLDVWGAYLPREIQSLHDERAGFRVRGRAADQYEVLARYRVNLAPLRSGAGVKGKIADGWLVGTPCVSTPVGAEGMTSAEGFAGVLATDAEGFAAGAVRLHEDESAWRLASAAGQQALRDHFTLSVNGPRVLEAFARAQAERDSRRDANLTGRLLRHGLTRGTEYFGRWLELKAKLKESAPAETLP